MKFDTPAGQNPIDRMAVIGQPIDRYEAKLKTTGTATYAYEQHAAVPDAAYGYILGAAIAKGRIVAIDTAEAQAAPGVIAVLTYRNAGPLGTGKFYVQRMLAAPEVDHYHQPVALVVAESFEQARAATTLIRVRYDRAEGRFDLEAQKPGAPIAKSAEYGGPTESLIGDFATAFAAAPVKLDETYTVPDQAHAIMEPHATIARWDGDKLTCWTSIQQMNWGTRDVAAVLGIPRENVRLISPFIGGGFGGKGTAQTELILAAAGARLAKRPVKVALQRPIMFNNTIHRPRTIQRVMLAAEPGGRLTAIGHESWNGNLEGGRTEPCVTSTRTLYAAPNRLTRLHLTTLDLAEGNAMRAPGEAPGLMALEIAMDEMAEKLGMDPVAFRLANDTQVEPEKGIPFSTRRFADCLRIGAEKFGWSRRNPKPGATRDGDWLIGLGMAGAIRGAPISKAGARARLDRNGVVTIETDMTDIGTGSYTIVQQTAAEMMGVPLDKVVAKLGDSGFPETPGSGGQQGGPSVTAGVYAACMKLREIVAQRLGFNDADVTFADGQVRSGAAPSQSRRPRRRANSWLRTAWNTATCPSATRNRRSVRISLRSAWMPTPANYGSAAWWRSAPPGGS